MREPKPTSMNTISKIVKMAVSACAVVAFLFPTTTAYAETSSVFSAFLKQPDLPITKGAEDKRAKKLGLYLHSRNSPLAAYAPDFIAEADKYQLDWKLLPAISGVESTFGLYLPAASHNGWGFGIYNDHVTRFASWQEGIETVAKSLRHDYIDRFGSDNIEAIGYVYAGDRSWSMKVRHFMSEIDNQDVPTDTQDLSISL